MLADFILTVGLLDFAELGGVERVLFRKGKMPVCRGKVVEFLEPIVFAACGSDIGLGLGEARFGLCEIGRGSPYGLGLWQWGRCRFWLRRRLRFSLRRRL